MQPIKFRFCRRLSFPSHSPLSCRRLLHFVRPIPTHEILYRTHVYIFGSLAVVMNISRREHCWKPTKLFHSLAIVKASGIWCSRFSIVSMSAHTHSECIHIRIWLVRYGWERCHLIPPHTQPVIVCERVCVTIQWAQWTSPECRKQKVQPRIMAENLQQQEKLCAYISDSCKTLLLYLFKPVQTYIAGNFGENWKPALGALFFFTAAFGVSFFSCLYFFLNSVRVYFVAVLHRFFFCSKFVVWFYFHGIWLLSQTEREREWERE